MKRTDRERWHELCEQAAVEKDHDRLMELIREIDRLLSEKEERLRSPRKPPSPRSPRAGEK